jgi:hypothetical protein
MAIKKKGQQPPKAETETKQQSPKTPTAPKPSTKQQQVDTKDKK